MECPVAVCDNGKVRGLVARPTHPDSKNVFEYFGIPFGEHPVGKLRFMSPKPYKSKWPGVRDCSVMGNVPLVSHKRRATVNEYFIIRSDFKKRFHEDCLNLNVYTTNLSHDAKLPVMVFLYGGSFEGGSNLEQDSTALCGMNDVVVVCPNYRVGMFGFLSLGPDSSCPGNAGLVDQQLALLWVKNNIHNFGGNQNNVTLFGESAGAISVGYHMNSPMSKGLFHKAICQSGAATTLSLEHPINASSLKALLQILKIDDHNPEIILQRLQQLDSQTLLDAYDNLPGTSTFLPTIDGKFVTKSAVESLKSCDQCPGVPVMFGYNDSEGMGIMMRHLIQNSHEATHQELMDTMLLWLNIIREKSPTENKSTAHEIISHYGQKYDHDDKFRLNKILGDFIMDGLYQVPTLLHADAYSHNREVYLYLGEFSMKLYHDKEFGGWIPLKPDWCHCDHADEIFLTFGFPFLPFDMTKQVKYTDEERLLSREFMSFLTNFAKNGTPNDAMSLGQWQLYEEDLPGVFSIQTEGCKMRKISVQETKDFWLKHVFV